MGMYNVFTTITLHKMAIIIFIMFDKSRYIYMVPE